MSLRPAPIRRRRRAVHVLALVAVCVACALATTACGDARRAEAAPRASFLVAAGDSTFWVDSDGDGVTLRRSPMLLAEHAGHYYELYLTDDDQS